MLTLRYLDVPPLPPRPLRIFSNQEKALEHVKNHVLTEPESYAWSLVVPEFRSVFNAEDRREVNHLARQLGSDPLPQEAQRLYDGYADAIGEAVRDAIARGWFWQEQAVDGSMIWHGVGKSGLYAIWDVNVIRTGYFDLADVQGPKLRKNQERREQGPLPRRRPARERAKGHELAGIPEDTSIARFEIFEKCWHNVRLAYGRACLQERRIVGIGRMDHWRNRSVLFQEWLAL